MKNECKVCQYAAVCLTYGSRTAWVTETIKAGVEVEWCVSCGGVTFNAREMLEPPCGWSIKVTNARGTGYHLCRHCDSKENLPVARKIKADLNELADAIERVASMHEAISQSRFKADAIPALLQRVIGGSPPMSLKKIQAVLDALPALKDEFLKPEKKGTK